MRGCILVPVVLLIGCSGDATAPKTESKPATNTKFKPVRGPAELQPILDTLPADTVLIGYTRPGWLLESKLAAAIPLQKELQDFSKTLHLNFKLDPPQLEYVGFYVRAPKEVTVEEFRSTRMAIDRPDDSTVYRKREGNRPTFVFFCRLKKTFDLKSIAEQLADNQEKGKFKTEEREIAGKKFVVFEDAFGTQLTTISNDTVLATFGPGLDDVLADGPGDSPVAEGFAKSGRVFAFLHLSIKGRDHLRKLIDEEFGRLQPDAFGITESWKAVPDGLESLTATLHLEDGKDLATLEMIARDVNGTPALKAAAEALKQAADNAVRTLGLLYAIGKNKIPMKIAADTDVVYTKLKAKLDRVAAGMRIETSERKVTVTAPNPNLVAEIKVISAPIQRVWAQVKPR